MKNRALFLMIILFVGLTLNAQIENGKTQFLSLNEVFEGYKKLLSNKSFYAFPESRENPLKWTDSIPANAIPESEISNEGFVLKAHPGEFFTYQIGICSREELQDVNVFFSPLTAENNQEIPVHKMTCFNKGGVDYLGKAFAKQINVAAKKLQALWIGMDLKNVKTGKYEGIVTVVVGKEQQNIKLKLHVCGDPVIGKGYDLGENMSRLNWLNSTIGIDNKTTKDYQPINRNGNSLSILGRKLQIAPTGLPSSISSYFTGSNQSLKKDASPIVGSPFRFIIEKTNGEIIHLVPGELEFFKKSQSKICWYVVNTSNECTMECWGEMEFDGFVDYKLKLTAKNTLEIKDIRLEIPVEKEKAKYMMGLGHEGGLRTPDWNWKWDISKNQDMLWLGNVNGGIRLKWKAENYVRPLVNIYYGFGPLNLPLSWGNMGKGGVSVKQQNTGVVIDAYSGERVIVAGDVLNYDFEMLITPFRVIDNYKKYGDRYFHGGGADASSKVNKAKAIGANIINIHHNEDLYPFINYPYQDYHKEGLTTIVNDAHREQMRMKFYYTTRELTKNLPEFWAMYSLNGEVIFPGPGNLSRTEALHPNGPNKWLVDNLREKYIPAWYNVIREGEFKGEIDLSVITTPDSRLNNFYIAGLDWMVRNMKIDGIYIDDSALDRFTLQRARKIIDNNRPDGRIDLHSWNHFINWAGFTNCLNLYMDLLPYIDLVWIGEGRDYNRMPDHWLVEVSGIPFGVAGQMLHSPNPWRGMVYGITNRGGYSKLTPKYLWQFFDKYDFAKREMIGYWDEQCPVQCNDLHVRASVYKGNDDIIIAVANWSSEDKEITLDVDWEQLGFDQKKVDIFIPEVEEFQGENGEISFAALELPASKGFLIQVKKCD